LRLTKARGSAEHTGMDFSDVSFATPQLRKGPTSRLLKRRSQAAPVALSSSAANSPQGGVTATPPNIRKSVADSLFNQTAAAMNATNAAAGTATNMFGYNATQYHLDVSTTATAGNRTAAAGNAALLDPFSKSVLNADETVYGVVPGLRATDNLYVDFLATISDEASGLQALDQVAELEELISGHDGALKEYARGHKNNLPHLNQKNMKEVVTNFANERNTWRLLGKLYHDRLTPNDDDDDEEIPMALAKTSEKALIQRLFRQDRKLREGQIVVDWLEFNERFLLDEKTRLEFFSEGAVCWENTLQVIQDGGGINYRRPIVSQIDPDAPRREGKPIHDLDQQDQNQLLRTMFAFIRAGLLETAQDLCLKMGQPWRAATLEGWKLFHDPNYAPSGHAHAGHDEKLAAEGNKNRDIWKKAVWRMLGDDKMGLHERAIYAPFCGNVDFLLRSCCQGWEDCLWAYAKCMVDLRVETEIRESMPRSFAELPRQYWSANKTNFEEIFTAISCLEIAEARHQAADPFRVVQKFLILGELNVLLDTLDRWTGDFGDDDSVNVGVGDPAAGVVAVTDPQVLRFLAHVVIVLRRVVPDQVDFSKGQMLLKRYVQFLISKDRINQVAWYTAQLPVETQIEMYASFLEAVLVDSDRRLALALAAENGLPIKAIKSRVVANIFAMEASDADAADEEEEEDVLVKRKIDSLTWLVYDKGQRDEAVYMTNRLIRRLVATDKFEAAKAACDKMPEDSIPTINAHCRSAGEGEEGEGEEGELNATQSNAVAEYLCWQLYFRAKEAFSDWFEHFHKGKPVQPQLPDNPSFTERAAHGERTKQYAVDLERWQSNQEHQSREACDRLYAAITFSGGWLVDQHGEKEGEDGEQEADQQRSLEIDYLRKLCLPQLVLLLHSVLHNTGQFKRALQIADLIAAEDHCLYQVYVQDNMRELLAKLNQSSLEAMAAAGANLDAWGCQAKA